MTKGKGFNNAADTSSMIVERDGKVLYVERGRDPYTGMLALPGGYLDCGEETLERCAVRELGEETGIRAKEEDLALVCVHSDPDRDPRGHVIDHVYAVLRSEGDPEAGDDAAKVFWIALGDEPRLAFDHNKAMEKYKIWRKENVESN